MSPAVLCRSARRCVVDAAKLLPYEDVANAPQTVALVAKAADIYSAAVRLARDDQGALRSRRYAVVAQAAKSARVLRDVCREARTIISTFPLSMPNASSLDGRLRELAGYAGTTYSARDKASGYLKIHAGPEGV